jgi:hypothetical protein
MTLPRAIFTWLALLAIAFTNGAFREFYLRTYLDELQAHQVSCGLGTTLIVLAVLAISRRWQFSSPGHAWKTGGFWTATTVVWEFSFGLARGYPWERLLNDYAVWHGRLWPFVLAGVFVAPRLAYALEQRRRDRRPPIAYAIRWAAAGWLLCGLAMAGLRLATGIAVAIWLHLAIAAIVFFVVAVFYWNDPEHLPPLPTAAVFVVTVVALDALIVAPFFEKSFAMFRSALGTWVPFAAIFFSSLLAARLLSRDPGERRFFQWMPSAREVAEPLPGDGYVRGVRGVTHAIRIAASPAEVWPWLAQMGCGRAGWYSYDRLDNWGHASASRIISDLQEIHVGDALPSKPDRTFGFEVLQAEPGRLLVLAIDIAQNPFRQIPWKDAAPATHQRSTWSFVLEPDGPNATRLVVRARSECAPAWRWFLWNGFFEVAHVIMQRKQLLNLRDRAERGVPA